VSWLRPVAAGLLIVGKIYYDNMQVKRKKRNAFIVLNTVFWLSALLRYGSGTIATNRDHAVSGARYKFGSLMCC
jgi:hypothetical protein